LTKRLTERASEVRGVGKAGNLHTLCDAASGMKRAAHRKLNAKPAPMASVTPHYAMEWLPMIAVSGVGIGVVLPSLAAAASYGLPQDRLAVGSAVNQAVRQIGFMFGVSATIALVGSASGRGLENAYSHLFLLLAICGFLTAALSTPIRTGPGRREMNGAAAEAESYAA
jgi:hypothetical protein